MLSSRYWYLVYIAVAGCGARLDRHSSFLPLFALLLVLQSILHSVSKATDDGGTGLLLVLLFLLVLLVLLVLTRRLDKDHPLESGRQHTHLACIAISNYPSSFLEDFFRFLFLWLELELDSDLGPTKNRTKLSRARGVRMLQLGCLTTTSTHTQEPETRTRN